MGFASELTDVIAQAFDGLGDEAAFTPRTAGGLGTPVATLAVLDEPDQDILADYPRAALRERKVSAWLPRHDLGANVCGVGIPQRGSLLTTLGRSFKIDSVVSVEPDRVSVALDETTP